jgi:hypothetical protein
MSLSKFLRFDGLEFASRSGPRSRCKTLFILDLKNTGKSSEEFVLELVGPDLVAQSAALVQPGAKSL